MRGDVYDIHRLFYRAAAGIPGFKNEPVGAFGKHVRLGEFSAFGHTDGFPVEAKLGYAFGAAGYGGKCLARRSRLLHGDRRAVEEPLRFVEGVTDTDDEEGDEDEAYEA